MERLGHQRIVNAATAALASNNFDVKYYRCEWEVDPAVRYIKGKVTVYFIVTSSTNFITLDLMSPLTADSVKQRNLLLTKSQSNNTLTINFSSTINAGVLDSVSIFYQGVPPDTGFGSFETSTLFLNVDKRGKHTIPTPRIVEDSLEFSAHDRVNLPWHLHNILRRELIEGSLYVHVVQSRTAHRLL